VVGFDRKIRDVLGRGAEGGGHPRVVEVASIPEQMGGGLDREVGAPFESADREPPVFVHDPRGEGGGGAIDRGPKVRVEKPHAQLGNF